MANAFEYWLNGQPFKGAMETGTDIGAMEYWLNGQPMKILNDVTAPPPPTGGRRRLLLMGAG